MKTIGLIGGIGWPSTISYYQTISQMANKAMDSLESPAILIKSVDNFHELVTLYKQNKWEEVGEHLTQHALQLQEAGAEGVLICSVTNNIPYKHIEPQLSASFINVIDPLVEKLKADGISRVGLLGTRATMEAPLLLEGLKEHGIDVVVPNEDDRQLVSDIIFEELCRNVFLDRSRESYKRVIEDLRSRGAQGLILGCTEIPLLISEKDTDLPLFDVAEEHALSALKWAME